MKLLNSGLDSSFRESPAKRSPNPYLSRSFLPTSKLTFDGANIAPFHGKSHDMESAMSKFQDSSQLGRNNLSVTAERSSQNDLNQDLSKGVNNLFSRYEQHALQFRENRNFSHIPFN